MSSEVKLQDIADVGKNALKDYDELLNRYNKLVAEHISTKEELTQLQQVAEPMYSEYGEIQTKYEMEKSLRTAAETYATRVLKDNKKIKRQSAMLVAQMSSAKPLAIDIDIDDSSVVENERIEELSATITKLQDEVVMYKQELEEARDNIGILSNQTDYIIAEREEYKLKAQSLQEELNAASIAVKKHQRDLKSLNRVSSLAVVDYSSLEERYETERALRLKAESYAHELERKRGSGIDASLPSNNLDSSEENEPLKKLLAENEKLHGELSEQEINYKSQLDDLQQQLKDSSSHETIENLEAKLEIVKENLERMTQEVEAEKANNQQLNEKITKLEKERDQVLNIPLPPPPPPPPGPAAGIGRLIITKKKKKEASLKKIVGTDAIKDTSMKNAIDEMMARIKSGNTTLRRVDMNTRPEDMAPKEEEGGAMKEMHKYLVSMKQKRRERSPKRSDDTPNELQKILAARRDRSDSVDKLDDTSQDFQKRSDSIDSGTGNELKKIAKSINKQPSLDTGAPKPKPRPRISQMAHNSSQMSTELASKLTTALNRIPDEISIPDEAQNGTNENSDGDK